MRPMHIPQPNLTELQTGLQQLRQTADVNDQAAIDAIIATIGDAVTYDVQWSLISNNCNPNLQSEITALATRCNIFSVLIARPGSDLYSFLENTAGLVDRA